MTILAKFFALVGVFFIDSVKPLDFRIWALIKKLKKSTIEVYSDIDDNSVVRMPEQDYLGSVIQGDALFLLHGEAMDLLEELKHNPGSYVFYKAYSVAKSLDNLLDHYISVCNLHGIKLDFRIECSVYDYDEPF